MNNPWQQLPAGPPYVLPAEQDAIVAFNEKAKPAHAIHLELLPEPYIGRPEAPVLLLSLNPGFSAEDADFQATRPYRELWHDNLLHRPADYPFYLLNPALDAARDGARWWSRILKQPLRQAGRRRVAETFLCVEFFPYHSRRYKRLPQALPSQQYGFYLVMQAMDRGAAIILMRSRRLWLAAVPRLADYPHLFALRNPQNPAVSPRNCPAGYPLVAAALASE